MSALPLGGNDHAPRSDVSSLPCPGAGAYKRLALSYGNWCMSNGDNMNSIKDTVVNYLFGTPDRLYTSISILISLLSFFGSVLLPFAFPEKIPLLIIVRDLIIFSLLFSTCIIVFYKYARRDFYLSNLSQSLTEANNDLNNKINDLQNKLDSSNSAFNARINSKLEEQYFYFHKVVHKFRDDVFRFYVNDMPNEFILSGKGKTAFLRLCHSITSSVKKTMTEYLMSKDIYLRDYDNVCVTVKLLLESDNIIKLYGKTLDKEVKALINENDRWIITVYRDPSTYEEWREEREVSSKIYSINGNSAFMHIFMNKQPYFRCDDLIKMGDSYMNENPLWREKYNATIVVPIRYYCKENGVHRLFGFISVDSLNRDKNNLFVNNMARYIVGQAADLMASFFLASSIADARASDCLTPYEGAQ